ncbi:YhcN/YlaJ family sporulation lipoprotein [Cytobacillus sp. FSL W7-1323]|uniref:YhcN/YlaJ family sporulation lipoprotein n=1 Tax=Cytobacillus kochii TaxID=859143 RepID=A0A248TMY1_9BACI|nr:YhcN/YlaJ family sporulation lipoprotein [Cytobacillus kochii]ASV69573.1 hypothetical protein CKF48_21025 [Cytobacillus kochii]MDQ0184360.1 YhcN/YlaJ family sporulation lipoprotein [Cytobacillus kochii]MED1604659.1 YhcN/YlaJ family sporulation lipoprotein [Cytobacillus kochii]
MKGTIIAVALSSSLLLTACGMNNGQDTNDTAYRAPDMHDPAKVGYERNGNNDRPSIDNNIHTRNVDYDGTQHSMRFADKTADNITQMDEVKRARVLLTGDNAYVAATLANGNELTQDLEKKIADQVKSTDQNIDDVYVSVNPDFYNRVDTYAKDVRNGKPIEGFFDEFSETVKRMFPNHE